MNRHPVEWISPAPLWARFAPEGGGAATVAADDQFRPAILRFASDDFMDRMLAILAHDPKALGELLARPETWRSPSGAAPNLVEREPVPRLAKALGRLRSGKEPKGALAAVVANAKRKEQAQERELPLKLYQPAHQRYYLVAADLVCQAAGFPLHALATGGREQIGFVMRRLLPPAGSGATAKAVEHAFVKSPKGAFEWKAVGGEALLAGEELLPLFTMNFADDRGHPRRVLAGMIPVGRREEYMGTGFDAAANTSAVSAHKEQLKMDVAEPWKNLIRTAFTILDKGIADENAKAPDGGSIRALRLDQARTINRQLQMQSWLVLLDLAAYLAAHLPRVWKAIVDAEGDAAFGAHTPEGKLFRWLGAAKMSADLKRACVPSAQTKRFAPSLRDALRDIAKPGVRGKLEAARTVYARSNQTDSDWPDFQFLLAGIGEDDDNTHDSKPYHFHLDGPYRSLGSQVVEVGNDDVEPASPAIGANAEADLVDKFVALVVKAIDPAAASEAPPLPFAASLQRAIQDVGDDPGWFVIRCIHVRCDCGPLQALLASPPTQRFQLASFFDPDAPARPIRIALPLDTSPAGLRKFNKNTALMVSDTLCGQMARAKGLGFIDLVLSVLPWPFHKDLDLGDMGPCKSGSASIGMICSLSIPIVTLCALILLMIIASILDYIFRWMPYLIMCFPVPGLKAKKPDGGAP